MTVRAAYMLLLVPALLWCAGFVLLPLAGAEGHALSGHLYGRVCHQLDDRSFQWFGIPWAVCIRCSSIYLAFTVTLVLMPAVRGLDRWTPLAPGAFALWLVPAVLDAGLAFTGWHVPDTATRVVTGSLAGVGLGVTIPPLFIEAVTRSLRYRTNLHTGDNDVR